MSANRSHHFVPRCYLRNFTATKKGATLKLFNIAGRRIIDAAPIKSQCAKPFLYGREGLEHILSDMEGKYAEWVTRGVLAEPPFLIEDVDLFVRFFVMVQYMRTAAAAARMRAHMQLMDVLADIPRDSEWSTTQFDTSDSSMAQQGVQSALDAMPMVSDSKLAFVRNCSAQAFITCDDPVVHANRLFLQRLKASNYGFGSAGALFYLPISPAIAVVLYDKDVYTFQNKRGPWINITDKSDVRIFNELVFLKARENIYYENAGDFSPLDFDEVAELRIEKWESGSILIPVGKPEDRLFREAADRPPEGDFVVATSQRHPTPRRWPRIMRFRQPSFAYTNGSAAGLVRRATAQREAMLVQRVKV